MKADIQSMKGDIQGLKTEMQNVKTDIQGIKTDLHQLRTEMNAGFERLDKRMDRLEDDMRSDRKKLDEIYQERKAVKITFGWSWAVASFFIAVSAAGLVEVWVV